MVFVVSVVRYGLGGASCSGNLGFVKSRMCLE